MTHNATCFANHMGMWAIEPVWMGQAVAAIRGSRFEIRADGPPTISAADTGQPVASTGGVAIIPLVGPLMKGDSSLGGTSTVRTRQAIRAANADDGISEILLHIDSPGGHVSGTAELADAVAGSAKPVTAHVDDLGASAAYWIASQASGGIYANKMAEIGSIGTVAVVEDSSKAAEMAGVEVHVISTGAFKAVGTPGVEIEEEHLDYLRERVDAMNGHFQAAVSGGRSLVGPALEAVSDGRVWPAAKAQGLGLIDGVRSLDETLDAILSRVRAGADSEGRAARLRARLRADRLRARARWGG
jgi:signal peptide peptidase SppA